MSMPCGFKIFLIALATIVGGVLTAIAIAALVENAAAAAVTLLNERKPPTPESPADNAINDALGWLKRHQHFNGHWASADVYSRCKNPKKQCATEDWPYPDTGGLVGHDVGVTALALLAFVRAGHTHKSKGEYAPIVSKALGWLLKKQVSDAASPTHGRFGAADVETWMYNHAIAGLALTSLLLASNDRTRLEKPITDALAFILAAQSEAGGWRYEVGDKLSDTSVTAWVAQFLGAAKAARAKELLQLDIAVWDERSARARKWLAANTAGSGVCGYRVPGDSGSRFEKYAEHFSVHPFSRVPTMTAAGILAQLDLGAQMTEPHIAAGLKLLSEKPPAWKEYAEVGPRLSTINFYYWYFGTLAMQRRGGEEFAAWRQAIESVLIINQRHDGCADGSWDTKCEWSAAGGRVYMTAMGVLALAGAK
ncbi:MAG: hypothetical protein ACKVX7_18540 [Planctomycetota bacterium]